MIPISKILNNNVVIGLENDKEIVFIGTGIGFKQKIGNFIDEEKIQTRFYPINKSITYRFLEVMEDTSDIVITLVTDMIAEYERVLGYDLNPILYINLCDHIEFALERYSKNIEMKNVLLFDIKRLYNKEFTLGLWSIDLINDRLEVNFDENEAAYIASHIINSEYNLSSSNLNRMTDLMNEIIKIIEYNLNFDLDIDSLSYSRLINHLKFFTQRIVNESSYNVDHDVFNEIIENSFPQSFLCAEKIKDYIKYQYNCDISMTELTYLTIHIQRLIDYR